MRAPGGTARLRCGEDSRPRLALTCGRVALFVKVCPSRESTVQILVKEGLDIANATVALRWWSSAGVTDPINDAPSNHFIENAFSRIEPSEVASRKPIPPQETTSPVASDPGGDAISLGSGLAVQAISHLAELRAKLEEFKGCSLKKTATQLVFSDGVPGSKVMLVGEAPGGEEDRIGRPFVGRAGQLLDRMLHAIGLDRNQVYIANVVPWRPPGNRTPTLQETQACLPFIKQQILLAAPEILVCLGASANQTLLGVNEGIRRTRGTWFTYVCENGRSIRAIAMLHPAYLLRQPGQKRAAWSDMRALARVLQN